MYGEIHQVIKDLILNNNGIGVWKVILDRARMDEVNHFVPYHYYSDELSLGLVKAASDIIGLPMDQFLEQMGDYMVEHVLTRHPLFCSTATNFQRFLQTLNTLFLCLRLSKPGKTVAEFSIEVPISKKELILHYSTNQPWLVQILSGFLKVIAISVYKAECIVKLKQAMDVEKGSNRQHYILSLSSQRAEKEWNRSSTFTMTNVRLTKSAKTTSGPVLPPGLICQMCPYHFVLDQDLNIHTCGTGITKLADLSVANKKFHHVFRIIRPSVCSSTFEQITRFRLAKFTLEGKGKLAPFILKGRMIVLKEKQHIVFIGAMFVDGLDGFRRQKLNVDDVPAQDGSRQYMMNTDLSKRIINQAVDTSELLVKTENEIRRLSVRLEEGELMKGNQMMKYLPYSVAKRYGMGQCVDERLEAVTFLSIGIADFDSLCMVCSTKDLDPLLKHLFRVVEAEVEDQGAHLLQTSGDAYMIVAGAPDYHENHAEMACNVAMEVLLDAVNIPTPPNVTFKLKMGIHTGSAVCIVLKETMPRYVMFGGSLHIATQLQDTSIPGLIQISPNTYRQMEKSLGFSFNKRGPVEIPEVQGEVDTHFLTGTPRRGEVDALRWNPSTEDLIRELQRESDYIATQQTSGCVVL